MSEIQSIAKNNYILATQQEVSHDNTLSGNGTVDSPLGLNETVLYEKTWTSAGGNAILSESANNFQLLRITFNIEASSELYCPVTTTIIDIEAMLANTTNRLFELTCVFSRSGGSNRYIVSRTALMQNDGITLTVQSVDESLNFGTTISSMNNSACRIMKVVGINRIANN